MSLVSVIVPVLNEAENCLAMHASLKEVASTLPSLRFEFLFVDDGSTDHTPEILHHLHDLDRRVKVLRFSRNFGSHAACLAGMHHMTGEIGVILSGDLQDPPELIPQMLRRIANGAEIVFGVRDSREDSFLTVRLANAYNRLMRRFAIANWPKTGADFVMFRREVRDVIVNWRQKNSSLFAQIMWTGFRQEFISYARRSRRSGQSKWTLGKKIKLLLDSFVSFSFTPIRAISYSGMAIAAAGFFYAAFVAINRVVYGKAVEGWSSLMVVLLLASGIQMLTLGVIGEYLWRGVDEVRRTPAYIVQSSLGVTHEQQREIAGTSFWSAAIATVEGGLEEL